MVLVRLHPILDGGRRVLTPHQILPQSLVLLFNIISEMITYAFSIIRSLLYVFVQNIYIIIVLIVGVEGMYTMYSSNIVIAQ